MYKISICQTFLLQELAMATLINLQQRAFPGVILFFRSNYKHFPNKSLNYKTIFNVQHSTLIPYSSKGCQQYLSAYPQQHWLQNYLSSVRIDQSAYKFKMLIKIFLDQNRSVQHFHRWV
ncbi:unnamed protein product (macronuclear) [Paramecium tetraurelia]|uniref:Uncharacterized protein n=1 Tax=Paramecium tetraurelia TaxID=5888 RepID=A0BTL0_PARTE|nr:uncharacterized protein GSPATT00032109001 [Paramecium tetraurelia]CAK61877.1 unnamed protein product [Paramecium tetraurelia]|eukprot:XP_001429275.1 hypothetical protein (macronuclear) [Paramecium tetraurelia strain d4-2]